VPADEDEGAGGDVHYVTVEQDPDQSLEVCVSACANDGKPGLIINPCFYFQVSELIIAIFMCIYVQELIETLVA
jgi:hypothetical protein